MEETTINEPNTKKKYKREEREEHIYIYITKKINFLCI